MFQDWHLLHPVLINNTWVGILFSPATSLCLSQCRTWISNVIHACCIFLCSMMWGERGTCTKCSCESLREITLYNIMYLFCSKQILDDLNFPIVNFPFTCICSNIPAALACHGDTILQIMWFLWRRRLLLHLSLTRKLLNQGFIVVNLEVITSEGLWSPSQGLTNLGPPH